jgi:hypothetical protein
MQRKLTHNQTLLAMHNATGLIIDALKDAKDENCIELCRELNGISR